MFSKTFKSFFVVATAAMLILVASTNVEAIPTQLETRSMIPTLTVYFDSELFQLT